MGKYILKLQAVLLIRDIILMVCHALANIHPNATNEVLMDWLQSNLCRCTSYEEIERAVRSIVNINDEKDSQE
jgi:aerobic-type carbon monoxide dehydrogenase small subunit (CoxS/CutS family)